MACRLRGATERLEPDPACRDALNHSPSDQEASQGLCAKPSLAGRKEKALCRASALRPYTVASAPSVFVCRPVLGDAFPQPPPTKAGPDARWRRLDIRHQTLRLFALHRAAGSI